jgi:small subunit ribosomal protein S20
MFYYNAPLKEKTMARHPSAERQHRYSVRRNKVNKKNTSALRTEIKKVRTLIENQDIEGAKKALPAAYAVIDKTVKKGTVHGNKGARHKSRLALQIEKISPAAAK